MKPSQKGVSLIELMLAVAVFVVGSASVAHLFIGARSAVLFSLQNNQAVFLAKEGIEEIRAARNNLGFDKLESSFHQITLDGIEFTRSIEVTKEDEQALITSSVEWESLKGEESLSISEILTDWDSGESNNNE